MKKKLPGFVVMLLGILALLSGATSNLYILIVAIAAIAVGAWLVAKL